MDTFLLKNLSDLLQTGIFYVEKSGLDDSWKTDEMNPLCQDDALPDILTHAADRQEAPTCSRMSSRCISAVWRRRTGTV